MNIADKIDSRIEKCNPKDLMILEYLKSIIFRNDELVHQIQVGIDYLSEIVEEQHIYCYAETVF